MKAAKVDLILNQVIEWAKSRIDIVAVALVGSWARGTARLDSDIDLMFLTLNAAEYRVGQAWMSEISWDSLGYQVQSWKNQGYGLVWSRHVYFEEGIEIEFSFGFPRWAETRPIDPGTASVIRNGCKILYDPENLLTKLVDRVK